MSQLEEYAVFDFGQKLFHLGNFVEKQCGGRTCVDLKCFIAQARNSESQGFNSLSRWRMRVRGMRGCLLGNPIDKLRLG